jgi:uncharacterized membrane protein
MTVINLGFDPDGVIKVFLFVFGGVCAFATVWAMPMIANERFKFATLQRVAMALFSISIMLYAINPDILIGTHRLPGLLVIVTAGFWVLVAAFRGYMIDRERKLVQARRRDSGHFLA